MASGQLSFAKIAASAGTNPTNIEPFAKVAGSVRGREDRKENVSTHSQSILDQSSIAQACLYQDQMNVTSSSPSQADRWPDGRALRTVAQKSSHSDVDLVDAIKAMNIHMLPTPSLVVNGSGSGEITRKMELIDGFSDDAFQRTESGSEIGTKPPSIDGKSITSGTTFALDEKESLRPDDSASVKAAEDDDTFSGVGGSNVTNSRIGSGSAGRQYRIPGQDTLERRNIHPVLERREQNLMATQNGLSEKNIIGQTKTDSLGISNPPDTFNLFYRQTPDEKLLEALESPKDRIFLLRLEQDVIDFVKDSKEPFIDLPPCNSFCRMLTHKLADYYHMTHQVNEAAGAVRIFRTPFCRLPRSLSRISNPPTSGNTPPPQLPMMKIMRRGGEVDAGFSPSKATSEAGSENRDKALSAKEKLSREEREAAYNKARERIFGKDDKNGDATPDTDDGNEMSRSSSVSTRDRSAQSKKSKPTRQRRDDKESFDKRSEYTSYFPPQQLQQLPTWGTNTQHSAMAMPSFNAISPGNYHSPLPPQFGIPAPHMNSNMLSNHNLPYNNVSQFPQQAQQQFHNGQVMGYNSTVPAQQIVPLQQWQHQPIYPPQYQSQRPFVTGSQGPVPYTFGQLPSTVHPADPRSQHPIPGSYSRHGFNPKTQSFIPSNTGLLQQSVSRHGSSHGSPQPPYNAFMTSVQQFGNGLNYNTTPKVSSGSLTSFQSSPHMATRPIMHQTFPPNGHQIPQNNAHSGQTGHHLPNYGNPATLPPKPPTGV